MAARKKADRTAEIPGVGINSSQVSALVSPLV
jgi:hypothetical protein